ncbi:hypothetical protein [Bacillus luti]|uniref:hypothetical protein n=1 Tax=Bacillus luti TaxID=2026191 RepID=UPI003CFDA95F
MENKIKRVSSYGKFHMFNTFIYQWFKSKVNEGHTLVSYIPFITDESQVDEMRPFFEEVEVNVEDNDIQTSHMTHEAMDLIYKTLVDKEWDSSYLDIFSFFNNEANKFAALDFDSLHKKREKFFYRRGSSDPLKFDDFISNLKVDDENVEDFEDEGTILFPPPLIVNEEKIHKMMDYLSKFGITVKICTVSTDIREEYCLDYISVKFNG